MFFRIPLFFPFAAILIGAMVWTALKPGLERDAVWRDELSAVTQEGFSISGDRLMNFTVNERAEFEVVGPAGARRAVLRSSGAVTPRQNFGVHYHFPRELTRIYEGGRMDLDLHVRSSATLGSDAMFVRCAAPGVMDSGWMRIEVGSTWEVERVTCDVHEGAARAGYSIIMWSDADGRGGRVELREIRLLIRPPEGMRGSA